MRVLALDTTTRAGSVAILDDSRELVVQDADRTRSHAERLPGDIMHALAAAGLGSADIDLWAVASGPGSFTGLRIGIAAIQGFAIAHRKPVAPVSALLALGEQARATVGAGAMVGAWMDALRSEVFTALYRVIDPHADRVGALEEIDAAAVSRPDDAWQRWHRAGWTPEVLVGDGAALFGRTASADVQVVPPAPLAPALARLAMEMARAGQLLGPAAIQPLYVRRPDVVIAREAQEGAR